MNTFKNKIQNATNFVIHNLKIPDKRQKKNRRWSDEQQNKQHQKKYQTVQVNLQ